MSDIRPLLEKLLQRGEIVGFSVEGDRHVVLVLASKAERVRRVIADNGLDAEVLELREYPKLM